MLRLDAKGFLLHKLEHKKFLVKITDWRERHAKGEFMFTIAISRFLFDWLKNHILKTDQLLADAIRASYPSSIAARIPADRQDDVTGGADALLNQGADFQCPNSNSEIV